jgi:hypothetical protein
MELAAFALHSGRTIRDDKPLDGVLHPWKRPGELPRHRVRAPNPQVEANRLDGMLRERVALYVGSVWAGFFALSNDPSQD